MGRVRLLRQPLPLLLGTPSAHARHPAHRLPIGFALTGAKADERTVLLDILHTNPTLSAPRPGQIIIGDKNYFCAEFETTLAEARANPTVAAPGSSSPCAKPSNRIFDTYKGQLNLENHGGRTPTGVLVRIPRRILALTTAIWHNDHTGLPIKRSLLAYDH
jgi:hypothetical protein